MGRKRIETKKTNGDTVMESDNERQAEEEVEKMLKASSNKRNGDDDDDEVHKYKRKLMKYNPMEPHFTMDEDNNTEVKIQNFMFCIYKLLHQENDKGAVSHIAYEADAVKLNSKELQLLLLKLKDHFEDLVSKQTVNQVIVNK